MQKPRALRGVKTGACPRITRIIWTLHGAWIKVLEYDDLEGGNTENSIEKLTICYQYWTQ